MSKKELTIKKHEAIRAEYIKMSSKTNARGIRLFTNKYIFDELSAKYFMSVASIEKVIWSNR